MPIYNTYHGQDIIFRLLSSGTAFAQAIKKIPLLASFAKAARSYGPVGICYILSEDELVIRQASAIPGGADWTVAPVLRMFARMFATVHMGSELLPMSYAMESATGHAFYPK